MKSGMHTITTKLRRTLHDANFATHIDRQPRGGLVMLVRQKSARVDWTARVDHQDDEVTVEVLDGSPEDVRHAEKHDTVYVHGEMTISTKDRDVDAERIAQFVRMIIMTA